MEKFVAIKNVNGGPKTIQHKKAVQKSAKIITASFLFLDKFLNINAMFFILLSCL